MHVYTRAHMHTYVYVSSGAFFDVPDSQDTFGQKQFVTESLNSQCTKDLWFDPCEARSIASGQIDHCKSKCSHRMELTPHCRCILHHSGSAVK